MVQTSHNAPLPNHTTVSHKLHSTEMTQVSKSRVSYRATGETSHGDAYKPMTKSMQHANTGTRIGRDRAILMSAAHTNEWGQGEGDWRVLATPAV